MKQTLKIKDAALKIGCSETHLRELVKAEKITSEVDAEGTLVVAYTSLDALIAEVQKHSKKVLGVKHRSPGTARKTTRPSSSRPSRKSNISKGMAALAQWATIPDDKRAVLLDLAEKHSTADLKLLLAI